MRKVLLGFLLLAESLIGQIEVPAFKWHCDPKDGKFITTPCSNCKKFYCWDGQIFSEEPGYTYPPPDVLAYWEAVHQRSQQIREDIDRRGKELAEKVRQGRENTESLNRGSAQRSTLRPGSQTTTVTAVERAAPAPVLPPIKGEKVAEIQNGMERAAVIQALGEPHGKMTIPQDDDLVEIFTYTLEGDGSARVRIEKGKVVSVK